MERVELPEQMSIRAPDGSEVRILVQGAGGSMAHFRLLPSETSASKVHRGVEELWFFVSGTGQMAIGDDIAEVAPGISVRIPPRTRFQFRNTGKDPLDAVAVTMPPWPGDDEALDAEPFWV